MSLLEKRRWPWHPKSFFFMLSEVAPTSTLLNWNVLPIFHHIMWMLIHCCALTMVTLYTLTTTKLASKMVDIAFERTTSCMAFVIYQPLLFDQCFKRALLTFGNKKNSFNDSYSNMGHPCKRMCNIFAN